MHHFFVNHRNVIRATHSLAYKNVVFVHLVNKPVCHMLHGRALRLRQHQKHLIPVLVKLTDDQCHCFKITFLVMLHRPAAFHFLYFLAVMLFYYQVQPIQKIPDQLAEQIILILKKEIQRACSDARFLANASKRCPRKAFFHKLCLGTFHKMFFCFTVMYLL